MTTLSSASSSRHHPQEAAGVISSPGASAETRYHEEQKGNDDLPIYDNFLGAVWGSLLIPEDEAEMKPLHQ